MRTITDGEKLALEALIDAVGLHSVLNAVAVTCNEKAEHVRSNWQDNVLALRWDRAGLRVGRVAGHQDVMRLSA